MISTFVHKVHV